MKTLPSSDLCILDLQQEILRVSRVITRTCAPITIYAIDPDLLEGKVPFLEQPAASNFSYEERQYSSTSRRTLANATVPALYWYSHRMTRLLAFLGACFIGHTVCLGWTPATRPKVSTAGMKTLNGNRLPATSLRMSDVSRVDSKDVPVIGYMKSEEILFTDDMSDEWELDCYSRPVMGADGKKLWEILLTDSTGSFRYLKTIPSNLVNSRNLRNAVEEVMEQAPVRPKMIRFFRNQMFNMITIALSTLEVEVKPSRRTYNMFSWLTERERNIYTKMPGYNVQLKQQTILDYDVSQPGTEHYIIFTQVESSLIY